MFLSFCDLKLLTWLCIRKRQRYEKTVLFQARVVRQIIISAFSCVARLSASLLTLYQVWAGLQDYINPRDLSKKSHPVRVNALSSVVSMTVLEVSVPSCPIFLAII